MKYVITYSLPASQSTGHDFNKKIQKLLVNKYVANDTDRFNQSETDL